MGEFAPILSARYVVFLSVLLLARAADFLSTWIATPNMVLEGNPIARILGWRWGTLVNLMVCRALAAWPFAAVTVATTSLLVAARNQQSAWFMRTLGEEDYRQWYVHHTRRAPLVLYVFCLAGQVGLIAAVGLALVVFDEGSTIVLSIGVGIVAYALAVLLYTLLAYWRMIAGLQRGMRAAGACLDSGARPVRRCSFVGAEVHDDVRGRHRSLILPHQPAVGCSKRSMRERTDDVEA